MTKDTIDLHEGVHATFREILLLKVQKLICHIGSAAQSPRNLTSLRFAPQREVWHLHGASCVDLCAMS